MNSMPLLYALLFLFFSSVMASPVPLISQELVNRDVYVPPVLYPHAGTVWTVGQRHNVTWDTSNPPAQITNREGFIFLREGGLTTPLVLAYGFDILDGRAEITVPLVTGGTDYAVVLFGDSGNFSNGTFTIVSPVNF